MPACWRASRPFALTASWNLNQTISHASWIAHASSAAESDVTGVFSRASDVLMVPRASVDR